MIQDRKEEFDLVMSGLKNVVDVARGQTGLAFVEGPLDVDISAVIIYSTTEQLSVLRKMIKTINEANLSFLVVDNINSHSFKTRHTKGWIFFKDSDLLDAIKLHYLISGGSKSDLEKIKVESSEDEVTVHTGDVSSDKFYDIHFVVRNSDLKVNVLPHEKGESIWTQIKFF